MKKTICIVLSLLVCIFIFTGCTKDYVYLLDNQTEIKLSFNSSNGYELSPDEGMFNVYKDEQVVATGGFMTKENAEIFIDTLDSLELVTPVEKGKTTRNDINIEFAKYIYENEGVAEYVVVSTYDSCDYGISISSLVSMDEAVNAFNRLIINLMK